MRTPSHLHSSPQTAFPSGDRSARALRGSRQRSLGCRRPLLPVWEDVAGPFKLQRPSPRSSNLGAPGPGAAKTRRGPARESSARHPRAATGPAAIRSGARAARAARERQGLGARAALAARTTAQGSGRTELRLKRQAGPCGSRRLLAPPPALAFSLARSGLPLHCLACRGHRRGRAGCAGGWLWP